LKKISKRLETNNFLHFLFELGVMDWHLDYKARPVAVDKIAKYLFNLEAKQLKRLVSDPIWDTYRTWKERPNHKERAEKYADEEFCQGRYGPMIEHAIARIIYVDKAKALFLAKHSRGLLLNIVLKNSYGEVANAGFRRAMKSGDVRVRKVAAKNGPIKLVDKMRFDSSASVRAAAIKRIGINHCYLDHINDPSKLIRSLALMAAPLEDFDYDEVMIGIADRSKKIGMRWADRQVARSILSKVSSEEALYYLNLSGNDHGIKQILVFKMENPS
jgi:hypothetical protein